MNHRYIILLTLIVFYCTEAFASLRSPVDSLDLSDSAFLSVMQEAQTVDTAKVVKDKGYDVSGMVNSKRWRPSDAIEFQKGGFFKNIYASPYVKTMKILNPDYSFAYGVGLTLGKWINPYFSARVGGGWYYWSDNFDTRTTQGVEVTATALFNLSSYLGGYDTSRFCEVSLLAGIGGLVNWKRQLTDKADVGGSFSGHFGANVNLRVFDRFNIFLEPQIAIHTNQLALSPSKNWRSYLLVFTTAVGVTYNFGQPKPQGERLSNSWKKPKGEEKGYFASLMAGLQFQNSRLVFESLKGGRKIGQHYALSFGRHYTDYFALRFSANYSRNNWIQYNDGKKFATDYVTVSLEGMFDVVRFAKYMVNKNIRPREQGWFGCSLVLGPEMGRMMKHDIGDDVSVHYVGLVGGIHPEFRVHDNISLFVEPRFSLVPYSAYTDEEAMNNESRNYYDCLFNFNIGIECRF